MKLITRSTTVLCVRRGDKVVMAGDGQVSLGETIVKSSAKKVRLVGKQKNVLAGFAGSTADALTLLDSLNRPSKNIRIIWPEQRWN